MNYLGDFKEDSTVYLMFNTFTSNDPSASSTITNFANTDVHIHKDDDLTQRNNAAGITVSINFDGITGSHMIKIDTNDNTVAGFWVTGKDYFVRIEGTTVDAGTINAVVGHFSIENRHNEVDVVKWLGQACHTVSENGVPKVDLDQIGGVIQSLTDLKDLVDTGYNPATHKIQGVVLTDTITTYTGNTKQTANNNTILAHADYGLAKLVRSTTPANTLDVSATGEVNAEDSVCDAILTGASHNTVNSLGRRIRELETLAIESGTAQAGSATSITLAATVNLADNVLDRNLVVLTDNTGKGQTRSIADYNNTTKVCIVDHDWDVVPDNTTAYQVMPSNTPLVVDHGQAQGGTATTVTLRASASATNNIFQNSIIAIVAGTGQGQARLISAYNGSTKVATINAPAWVVNPDATSIYGVMPYGVSCACNVSTDVLSLINTEIDTALSDINLDHLCKTATAGTDMTTEVADNTILSRVLSNGDTSVFAPSTDGLQPIRDRGDAGWIAATGFSTHSAADVLAATVEGTLELKQAMQAIMSFCAGKVTGGGTTTITFRDHADSKNRLVMTVDTNGDRSAITYSFD